MALNPLDPRDKTRLDFFEKAAGTWESVNYDQKINSDVRELIQSLKLKSVMNVLDVGCGRGALIPHLREALGQSTLIMALDASESMLKGVIEKDPSVKTIHARAEAIPLPDNHVDLIVCFSAFPHFHDQAAAASEFYRVLVPDGLLYILHLCDSQTINMHHDGHHAVHGDHLPSPDEMKKMFSSVGFKELVLDENQSRYYFSARK
jgi:ubiquinone/menaquinone biosynthesis C-methylase UbiE